jgi:hypothetical protein
MWNSVQQFATTVSPVGVLRPRIANRLSDRFTFSASLPFPAAAALLSENSSSAVAFERLSVAGDFFDQIHQLKK